LHLTVIVKATLALEPGGAMPLIRPDPLVLPEPHHADDLAPFTRWVDVWLEGHAQLHPGARTAPVRLGIYREGKMMLDKRVDLARLVAPARPGVFPLTPLGPVARPAPLDLTAMLVEVPADFVIEKLQWAPKDQWLRGLAGDEWIGLAGTSASGSFATRLPGIHALARAYSRERPGTHEDVALAPSSLVVDCDSNRCRVVWRGQMPLQSAADLALTQIVAGVATETRPIQWQEPVATLAPTPPPQPRIEMKGIEVKGGPAKHFDGTMAISASDVAKLAPEAIPSAWSQAAAGATKPDLSATMDVVAATTAPATPFQPQPIKSQPSQSQPIQRQPIQRQPIQRQPIQPKPFLSNPPPAAARVVIDLERRQPPRPAPPPSPTAPSPETPLNLDLLRSTLDLTGLAQKATAPEALPFAAKSPTSETWEEVLPAHERPPPTPFAPVARRPTPAPGRITPALPWEGIAPAHVPAVTAPAPARPPPPADGDPLLGTERDTSTPSERPPPLPFRSATTTTPPLARLDASALPFAPTSAEPKEMSAGEHFLAAMAALGLG
jgi:hypothetical protein